MSQFMEVVEFLDPGGDDMVHRVPEEGSGELKFGAMCIVRDSQAAVFFKDGKGMDVLGPGRHMLSTGNLPILTKMLMLPWGFESIFKAEVYFVNQKVFIGQKWGTRDPVAFKDSELGMVRLRAFGTYTLHITQPLLFVNSLVGTQGVYTTEAITDYLRDVIVSRLNDLLGERLDTILDLPKSYDELAMAIKGRLAGDFGRYGLELQEFYVNSITPPEEVQKMIDQRSQLEALGDMDRFMKFKAAMALGDAAKTEGSGGILAAGVGMGAGAGLGMMLPGMVYKTLTPENGSPESIAARGAVNCPKCHADVPLDGRFCPKCGHQMVVTNRCPACGKDLPAEANFCMVCGLNLKQRPSCPTCNVDLPPGTKFCTGCGEKLA
ncbi:SPFH domain-containing protein [Geobacter sp. AOG2]|uniref:SPFH domain-containing protein n=1 Tax=Geobacter sp. AOG2 TaxID=1566347 RepID=UPI001CC45856|nr:SPFH domain-containing protein [Geobacter sp. AOG2]GFE60704.1 virion core protein (lumpy skin disease virus) [Geobacter sp. AOG2]